MDAMCLLPFSLAGGGGTVDDAPVNALAAAGVTMLQRSGPLVRALMGKRSAILLPPGPAHVTALMASDGRGAVILDPTCTADELQAELIDRNVGAVFTVHAYEALLPSTLPRILLDDAPSYARLMLHGSRTDIDLGTHHGFLVAGDTSLPGVDEECVLFAGAAATLTHARVIEQARTVMEHAPYTPVDRTLSLVPWSTPQTFIGAFVAPLLAGGTLHTLGADGGGDALMRMRDLDATIVVAPIAAAQRWLYDDSLDLAPLRRLKRLVLLGNETARPDDDDIAAHERAVDTLVARAEEQGVQLGVL